MQRRGRGGWREGERGRAKAGREGAWEGAATPVGRLARHPPPSPARAVGRGAASGGRSPRAVSVLAATTPSTTENNKAHCMVPATGGDAAHGPRPRRRLRARNSKQVCRGKRWPPSDVCRGTPGAPRAGDGGSRGKDGARPAACAPPQHRQSVVSRVAGRSPCRRRSQPRVRTETAGGGDAVGPRWQSRQPPPSGTTPAWRHVG